MPLWGKGKSKDRSRVGLGSSSASESGDSPTSIKSQQDAFPDTAEPSNPGQPSSSRRDDHVYPPAGAATGKQIIQTHSSRDRLAQPLQPIAPLDYQPPEHRGFSAPSSSSKRIYNMQNTPPTNDLAHMYIRHALDTFKFGSPSISTVTETSSLDRMSSEETDEDSRPFGADVTPRPSLAIQPEVPIHRSVQSGISTSHSFDTTTPASASVPSLVIPGSDVPGRTQITPYFIGERSTSSLGGTSYDEDYDDEDFSDPDLEVSSLRYDDSGSHNYPYWDVPSENNSFVADYLKHRRGSNPIPIPGIPQDGPRTHVREREDSIVTLRRPSRSWDNPISASMGANALGTITIPQGSVSSPTSLPGSEVEWDHRRKVFQEIQVSPGRSKFHPPISSREFAGVPSQNLPGPSSASEPQEINVDFDNSIWDNIANGIKGGADLGNVDAVPIARHEPGFLQRITGVDAPRRMSVASGINDTFQKHALLYKDGHDWSFRKAKTDIPGNLKKKRPIFIPFNERPAKGGPPWKGMPIGLTEQWKNDITGTYKVERLEIHAGDGRIPQQRLSVHHYRHSRHSKDLIPGISYDPHNGPNVTVHKHSKAAAFSLSRHYRDKSQTKSTDRRVQGRAQPLRNAVYINSKKTPMILLAPRRVQVAYTSTTTTRKLESHGFLDDEASKARDAERMQRDLEDERARQKRKQKEQAKLEREKEKERKAAEERAKKGKGKATKSQDSKSTSSTLSKIESEFTVSNAKQPQSPSPMQKANALPAPPTTVRSQPESGPSTVHLAAPALEAANSHASSERTLVNDNRLWNRERPYYQDERDNEDELDSEDEQLGLVRRTRKRTPHNEAYHSLSPESIDSFASYQDNHSRSFFWFGGRNSSSRSVGQHMDIPYNPPWLLAPSRPNNYYLQMQVVAGLNNSFKGVGLLPTDRELRESRRKALKNQENIKSERRYTSKGKQRDVFVDLPEEALYMIVPLWPAETDPTSAKEHPFEVPPIPINKRLYALVYYKPHYSPDQSRGKGKRKSRGSSPTTSYDGFIIDDRNVLMSQFYIGARVVAYSDLEGTGVRVPEHGLSVVGPLREAYENIPLNATESTSKGAVREFWDYIIGTYYSRDYGMEFYPEGFKKMGLATQKPLQRELLNDNAGINVKDSRSTNASTSSLSCGGDDAKSRNPSSQDLNEIAPFNEPTSSGKMYISGEDEVAEPPIILTQIGRAVLEMAFMGGLAVTSFGPTNTIW